MSPQEWLKHSQWNTMRPWSYPTKSNLTFLKLKTLVLSNAMIYVFNNLYKILSHIQIVLKWLKNNQPYWLFTRYSKVQNCVTFWWMHWGHCYDHGDLLSQNCAWPQAMKTNSRWVWRKYSKIWVLWYYGILKDLEKKKDLEIKSQKYTITMAQKCNLMQAPRCSYTNENII